MKNYSIDNIIYIDKTTLTFLDELGEIQHISLKLCSQKWYSHYHRHSLLSIIKKITNRYVGDRVWNIGGKSCLSFYAYEIIEFIIQTPLDTRSKEYEDARTKWSNVIMQIQASGWWLFDCN